jgi:hypothetical protein
MTSTFSRNPDALPQLIGEFKPLDEWQAHVSRLFYGLYGGREREFYQTFAAADYRLAHALAADYHARVLRRERARGEGREPSGAERPLVIHEWGCGNGNLAACFLTHLKTLDRDGTIYPRLRYVLVDDRESVLETARKHPDLASHLDHVETLAARAEDLAAVADGTVDRIICNELWNELPSKLMLRKGGEIEEEYLRPNLSEAKHDAIADWAGFVHAFEAGDSQALGQFPSFLNDLVWEKEYRKAEWQKVPYRKTITEFLKKIDEEVLVPVNLVALATLKEAKRVLAAGAVGFSSFDAGTPDLGLLNDPEKPCYGQFGGQFSFMVNFALMEAVAKHLGMAAPTVESQKEFVGRALGINVLSLMDLLGSYPGTGRLAPWEQDRLILRTIEALNRHYHSPYERRLDFPLRGDMLEADRTELQALIDRMPGKGIPDTVAYLSEDEVMALRAEPRSVDYFHFFMPA